MVAVYSTMTNPTSFVEWAPGGGDIPVKKRVVTIKGGAGLVSRKALITPLGVKTEVSDDDYAYLLTNNLFNEFVRIGYIKVLTKGRTEADTVAADMAQRDGSAPLVPNDFAPGDEPKVGASTDLEATPPTKKPRNREQIRQV